MIFIYTVYTNTQNIIFAYFSQWLVESLVLVLQPSFACFLWGESDALLLDLDIRELLRRCHAEKKTRPFSPGERWKLRWGLMVENQLDHGFIIEIHGIKRWYQAFGYLQMSWMTSKDSKKRHMLLHVHWTNITRRPGVLERAPIPNRRVFHDLRP